MSVSVRVRCRCVKKSKANLVPKDAVAWNSDDEKGEEGRHSKKERETTYYVYRFNELMAPICLTVLSVVMCMCVIQNRSAQQPADTCIREKSANVSAGSALCKCVCVSVLGRS